MRFTANGPSIPDELLVARDAGDVILFCGAGVSQQEAGLPSFAGLGREVIRLLGAAKDSRARLLLEQALALAPMPGVGGLVATDRVFGLLEREFEVSDVRAAVSEAIRPRPDAGLGAHRALLDLATARGTTRLVTTNFDLLFESCDPTLLSSGPPNLPDPHSDRDFRGIVHLHGRVDEGYRTAQDDEFVISSSDFGRAYLSLGWATRFIQALLSRFQILFVGYTADDPPVQYLLEGLNLRAGTRNRLYALQHGDERSAVALWEHRGVQAIAFEDFGGLWETLGAWAARARDERGWHEATFARAASGPKGLLPYERGQVAHVLSTSEGVRRVVLAAKPLNAEWLLVADPSQRYASPGGSIAAGDGEPPSNPFEALGLDDDLPPAPPDPESFWRERPVPADAIDLLRSNTLDRERGARSSIAALAGRTGGFVPDLPPRLRGIGVWLRQMAHQPVALWWAAHQPGLHPAVLEGIENALLHDGGRFPPAILRGWRMLIAARADRRPDPMMLKYEIERRAKQEGWNASLVRELAGLYRPRLTAQAAYSLPHPTAWDPENQTENVIQVGVDYPHPHESIDVPDIWLAYAVSCFRGNLDLSIALEQEISGTDGLHMLTSRGSDGGPDPSDDSYGITGPVVRFQRLMARLAAVDPEAAREQFRSWPTRDEYVFARLRIWAAGAGLLDGGGAGTVFRSLPDRAFWGSTHERDFLYALRDRWRDLSDADRSVMEERLLRGSYPWDTAVPGRGVELAAYDRLNRLHWLSTQGVMFNFDVSGAMAAQRLAAPQWTTQAGDRAADSNAPQVFSIERDTRPDPLDGVPIGDILRRSAELRETNFAERTERDPFRGLAVSKPVLALAALTHAARSGEAPRWAWSAFLGTENRPSDPPRLVRSIAARLCALPPSELHEIAYPVSIWMEAVGERFFEDVADALPGLWRALMAALRPEDGDGRRRPHRSWATEALNAPVGKLFGLAMKDPATKELKAGAGFPSHWTTLLDDLLALPGDLRRHTLVMLGYQVTWLFTIDRDWTEGWMLRLVNDDSTDGDALWEGLLWAARMPSRPLYGLVKKALLERAVRDGGSDRQDRTTIVAGFLLAGWGSTDDDGTPLVLDDELRETLIHTSDEFRRRLLWQLERWCAEPEALWRDKVGFFFEQVWPKQRALHTPAMSGQLANFALVSGDLMPRVVAAILPRLVPIRDATLRLDTGNRTGERSLAHDHPGPLLDLLWAVLGEDASLWPYRVEHSLEGLAQASETAADPRLSELRRRLELR